MSDQRLGQTTLDVASAYGDLQQDVFQKQKSIASTMNFLLAREDAEKHAGTKSCFYCNKVFNNYRALGGHLRIHQEDKTLRTLSYPGRPSNSMAITRNPPASLPNSQQNSSAGGNNPPPFTRAPPAFDHSWMFCSNGTNHASRSKFSGSNHGVAQPQTIMSPDFSYIYGNGATYYHNSLASIAFSPAGANAAMSSAFASSGSVLATCFPIGSSLYWGSNGVGQFNTDEFQISQDGLPPSFGGTLLGVQGYSHDKLPNPTFAVTNPDLGFGSYQLPGFNESVAVCAFSPGPPPCSSLDKIGPDSKSLLMCEEGKRPYLAEELGNADIMNASKKLKIAANAHDVPENSQKKEEEPENSQIKEEGLENSQKKDEPENSQKKEKEPENSQNKGEEPENSQKKELSLLVDTDDSISASETCSGGEEEGPVDVDLSLHL